MAVEVRETDLVTSSSYFYRRGFYQRSARRANGDTVFITGDFQWEVEHVRRLLMKLARRHKLKMIEIAKLALFAPIKPNQEEPLQTQLAVVETVSVELPSINDRVPNPGDDVDLALAMEEFQRDVIRSNELLELDTLETAVAVASNLYRWARFWVVRHPSAQVRAKFAANLNEAEPIRAKVREQAERMAAKWNGFDA
jgi:hypothetical protein